MRSDLSDLAELVPFCQQITDFQRFASAMMEGSTIIDETPKAEAPRRRRRKVFPSLPDETYMVKEKRRRRAPNSNFMDSAMDPREEQMLRMALANSKAVTRREHINVPSAPVFR